MNSTIAQLMDGSCDLSVVVNSSILQGANMMPFPLYDLAPIITDFNPTNYTTDNVWLYPTYAVSIVTAYWARAVAMVTNGQTNAASNYAGPYMPTDEKIISSHVILDAAPLLYFVLAVQPFITLVALAITAALYHVLLGRGFGIVSILSGIDMIGSQPINGAGLSGKLKGPITPEVTVAKSWPGSQASMTTSEEARIRYRLVRKRCRAEESRVRRGQMCS
jgi:hypothetical protein